MKTLQSILAVVLVLGFILAPVAEAGITMVWSRFLAVKADRVLVTTDGAVGAPSGQTAGTVVIEAGGNTPALSISGYAGQTEPLVYLEDGAGTEVLAIGPAGELTTTGAMSLGDATFNGDMVITGTLDVQGDIFDSTGYLSLEDDIDLNGTMVNTDGAVSIGDSVVITDALQVDGRVTVNANAIVTGTLDVQNYIYNSLGALYVFGDQDLYGYLYSTNGPVGISDNVVVTGTMDIQGNVADSGGTFTIGDDASVTGDLSVTGATSLDSGITDTGIFTITAPGLVIDAGDGKMLSFIPGSDPNFGVGTNNTFGPAAEGSSILGGAGHTNNVLYGSIGGGITNTITSADYANITGGQQNTVTGGEWCFIGAGRGNTCTGQYGSVAGGFTNVVTGTYSLVAGGTSNEATGEAAAVLGGNNNAASGASAVALGGANSTASGSFSVILAGSSTTATGNAATVIGSSGGTASGTRATIIGGANSTASGDYAICLGNKQLASGNYSFVGGGYSNTASGDYSLATGRQTTASGDYTTALGRRARATYDGEFVWADSTNADFTGVITDSFNIRAAGGSYFTGALHADVGVTQVTTDTLLTTNGRGGWYYLEAGGAITTTLPTAAASLSYCFFNLDGNDYYIEVDTGDQVHTLTNAAGDRVTNTTAGDSICLLAINDTYWIATQRTGTWADAD